MGQRVGVRKDVVSGPPEKGLGMRLTSPQNAIYMRNLMMDTKGNFGEWLRKGFKNNDLHRTAWNVL